MDFKEENFPVYQLLQKMPAALSLVDEMRIFFEAAKTGGDTDQVLFAAAAITICDMYMPGMTEQAIQKTVRSGFSVFKDAAGRGNIEAKILMGSAAELSASWGFDVLAEEKPATPKAPNLGKVYRPPRQG